MDKLERLANELEYRCAKREYSEAHARMVKHFTQGYDVWSLAAYLDSLERLIPRKRTRTAYVPSAGNTPYVRMVDGRGNGRKTPRGSIISSSAMRRKGR
ncbi:hypothetical protein SEA_BEUFFERT_262 [Streptomyces phage Beuffert]|nr:hypothetical protein SEA_BEUFFERT_262 [Streptomyces phage Beuffert]